MKRIALLCLISCLALADTPGAFSSGVAGPRGLNSLIVQTAENPGANCTYGGTKVQTGLDANRNAVLDAAEVTYTRYICTGATGATGPTGPAGTAANLVPLNVPVLPLLGTYTSLYYVAPTNFTITSAYAVFNTAAMGTTGSVTQTYSDGTHTCTASYDCASQTSTPAVVSGTLSGTCTLSGTITIQVGGTDGCSGAGSEAMIQQWFSGHY